MDAAVAKAGPSDSVPSVEKPKRAPVQRESGLRFLLGKNKITRAMCAAGERYALGVRVASCGDAAAVKSCLASLEGGRGGGGAMFRTRSPEELEAAEWVAEYRRQTTYIRTRFFDDVELMGVLDSICIRGLTPREIAELALEPGADIATPGQVQRGAEKLEAVAYTVLKLLIGHLHAYDNTPQVGSGIMACAA